MRRELHQTDNHGPTTNTKPILTTNIRKSPQWEEINQVKQSPHNE